MKYLGQYLPILSLVWFLLLAGMIGCEPEDEMISTDPGIRLSFSSDTVLFDTVFSSIGSTTKRLMVFNKNDNAVNIERIEVAGGSNSPYTLTVRGLDGKDFNDQLLLGKDSLLIL
ncbi:MAG: hypothetical protein O7F74_10905, partial [Bacteroidetes bacterium]|nr:hypothetical protein [Bacteroidota bacterium]